MKPTKLLLAEHAVASYFHSPEFGVTIADVLDPEYWSHVAPQLRVGHEIRIMAGDGSWWALLLVRAVGRTEAVVQDLIYKELGNAPDASVTDSEFDVVWRGPARKFGVVRKSDKAVVKDEFVVREHAEKWLKGHLVSMAR